ncbi:N-6 DNA methylase [Nocardiopsis nanhaiensis]
MAAVRIEVTSADIARLAGVRPAAVSNWRRRHSDFPKPVGGTGRSPRFDLAEVEAWLAARGTGEPIDPQHLLFQTFDSVRDNSSGHQHLGTVGLLLFHLHRNPGSEVPSDIDDLRELLTSAERDLTGARWAGAGIQDMAAHRPELDLEPHIQGLLVAAAEAARQVDPAQLFEALVRHDEAVTGPSVRSIPRRVAALMVELAGEPGAELVDPACGRGQVLLAGVSRSWRRVRAQDGDPTAAWVAALRLAFAIDDSSVDYIDVHADNALRRPAYPMGCADAVVFAPPVGDRNWGLEEFEHDWRWLHGVPPRLESELAWVQHALAQVRPEGCVVALMPPATAERHSGRRIRRSLVQSGAVRAVVSLPAGLAAHHALPLHLWILERPAETGGSTAPVLFIDAENAGPAKSDEEWSHLTEDILSSWDGFRQRSSEFSERPGKVRAVSRMDLLDEEVDLTPRRHLSVRVSVQESEAQVERFRVELGRLVEESRRIIDAVPSFPGTGHESLRFVTVGELAERGAVTVRRPPDPRGKGSKDALAARAITVQDLVEGRSPSVAEAVHLDPMSNPPIGEGDVLVPSVLPGRRPLARVAGERESGAYPGPGVYVIRPDRAVLDSWFLAGMLTTGEGARQVTRGGSGVRRVLRIDPRRLVLPVLPMETQRRYGKGFYQVARLAEIISSMQGVGEEFFDAARDLMIISISKAQDGEFTIF